jgi:hypothetical protein
MSVADRVPFLAESRGSAFARSRFAQLIAGPGGRAARVGIGVGLVAAGLWSVGGPGGRTLPAAGLLPIAAGALDFCLLGPVFGARFWGREIRAARS